MNGNLCDIALSLKPCFARTSDQSGWFDPGSKFIERCDAQNAVRILIYIVLRCWTARVDPDIQYPLSS